MQSTDDQSVYGLSFLLRYTFGLYPATYQSQTSSSLISLTQDRLELTVNANVR